MEYPVEKHGIRFYHYYFYKVEKPIKIEAYNKSDARVILERVIPTLPPQYQNTKIVGESVTLPLKGISEKNVKGVKFIWVGENLAKGGWMDEGSYNRMVNHNK
jgi:hypothetical protein